MKPARLRVIRETDLAAHVFTDRYGQRYVLRGHAVREGSEAMIHRRELLDYVKYLQGIIETLNEAIREEAAKVQPVKAKAKRTRKK